MSDANTKIECNIVSKKTEKLTEGSGIVTIQAPDYNAKDIVLSLNKIKIAIDIKGSVVDPYNKPVPALKLNFHSDPTSIQSSITTNNLGLYDISNTEVFPFTPYKFFVDFIDL